MDKRSKIDNREQASAAKDLPYMSQDELQELIKNQREIVLTKPEIEYLNLRRRRMSIEMVRSWKILVIVWVISNFFQLYCFFLSEKGRRRVRIWATAPHVQVLRML